MATNNDGGPAFPRDEHVHGHNGMMLRDYFAAKALSAMLANSEKEGANRGGSGLAVFPRYAYEWADAMLKAREQ